jgi:hypothetical protein
MRTVPGLGFLALLAFFLLPVSAHAAATCSITPACGLNGTADGQQVDLDGIAGGPCYTQNLFAIATGFLTSTFWIQPVTLTNGGLTKSWTVYSGHNPVDGVAVVKVDAYHLAGGAVRLRLACRRDDGTYAQTPLLTISSTGIAGSVRQMQVEWAAGAGTGFCRMTRLGGGFPTVEIVGLDNDTLTVKRTRIGANVGLDTGEAGAYCTDELVEIP